MNPLNTIQGTIVAGVILADRDRARHDGRYKFNVQSIIMWLHVLAGITWIGLLYYFNFVQVPALAAAAKDQGGPGGAGISKYVAPRALLWFRWAAVATWLTGAAYLGHAGLFVPAFTLQPGRPSHRRRCLARHDHAAQRLGADMAEPEEGAWARRSDGR